MILEYPTRNFGELRCRRRFKIRFETRQLAAQAFLSRALQPAGFEVFQLTRNPQVNLDFDADLLLRLILVEWHEAVMKGKGALEAALKKANHARLEKHKSLKQALFFYKALSRIIGHGPESHQHPNLQRTAFSTIPVTKFRKRTTIHVSSLSGRARNSVLPKNQSSVSGALNEEQRIVFSHATL